MNVAERERQVWMLDQRINQRGFKADLALARAAIKACKREKKALDKLVFDLTEGRATSATQRARLQKELDDIGVELPNMQAATLSKALDADEVKGVARELLDARQRVSKSSTAKFGKIIGAVSPDGRLRGSLQYAGGSRTARWAGRIFQPHNMPRPECKPEDIENYVKAVKLGMTELLSDNAHQICSDLLRSLVIAEKGRKLLVADWNAIEGRYGAWLADEVWKLRIYAANDRDIYIETYRRMFGLPETTEVSRDQRQQGKCFELSMGFEGGVGALVSSAKTYGVDLHALATGAWRAASVEIRERAKYNHDFALVRKDELAIKNKALWVRLEAAKLMWRQNSPATVRLWKLYKQASHAAVKNPGRKFKAGKCIFYVKAGYLIIRMPSGRSILYASPKLRKERLGGEAITYLAPYGGRQYLYGGKILENVDQAGARDILAEKMLQLDDMGYPIVLHVHDEILCEVDRGDKQLTLSDMMHVMEADVDWAPGLPLKTEGYQALRYRKE